MMVLRQVSARDRAIVELFNAGRSYKAIAAALSDVGPPVSRGVVAGVISRNRHLVTRAKGLDARTGKIPRPAQRRAPLPVLPAPPPPPSPDSAQPSTSDPAPEDRLSLTELRPTTCRWPYGEGKDTTYCGKRCRADQPYCAAHMAVAYQPNTSWNERRRDPAARSQVTAGFR